jgi:hypothetical protein
LQEIKNGLSDHKIESVVIPNALTALFDEIKELTFFRTARTDSFYEALGLARPILFEIAEYFTIPFKTLANYDVDTLLNEQPIVVDKNFTIRYTN